MTENQVTADFSQKKPLGLRWYWWVMAAMFDIVLIAVGVAYWLTTPPGNFTAQTITIEPGESVSSIVAILADANVVRSADALYGVILYRYPEADIKAGTYAFTEKQSAWMVAEYITSAIPQEDLVRLTFPEGMRSYDYAAIATSDLPEFDRTSFIATAIEREGYLWPETYFVPETYTAESLLTLFDEEFGSGTADLQSAIAAHPLSEYEILTLASIIEREANSEVSMKMVSGILQNRLTIGMALQADATIEYILDTPLGELPPGQLAAELRDTESPYNSYKNIGLPPTPIGNPGRQAIEAVLNPTPSEYLFYITGNDGEFYYAETFAEHQLNITHHLR